MKKNLDKKLAECSDGEMVDLISQALSDVTGLDSETTEMSQKEPSISMTLTNPNAGLFAKRMSQYLGMLRAMHLWYHSAHHATRGVGFSGDHPELYGNLYSKIGAELDGAIEKAVGLSNDEEMACPVCITSLALTVMKKYPTPPKISSLSIASTALQMENDYIALVKAVFEELESANCLSLGLNDFLMASSNDHEGHVYMLQQRIKTSLED